tara:strand:- start:1483 stop:2037 length:555 start_codon:yes stop_codon:yes gene_type:complete
MIMRNDIKDEIQVTSPLIELKFLFNGDRSKGISIYFPHKLKVAGLEHYQDPILPCPLPESCFGRNFLKNDFVVSYDVIGQTATSYVETGAELEAAREAAVSGRAVYLEPQDVANMMVAGRQYNEQSQMASIDDSVDMGLVQGEFDVAVRTLFAIAYQAKTEQEAHLKDTERVSYNAPDTLETRL